MSNLVHIELTDKTGRGSYILFELGLLPDLNVYQTIIKFKELRGVEYIVDTHFEDGLDQISLKIDINLLSGKIRHIIDERELPYWESENYICIHKEFPFVSIDEPPEQLDFFQSPIKRVEVDSNKFFPDLKGISSFHIELDSLLSQMKRGYFHSSM